MTQQFSNSYAGLKYKSINNHSYLHRKVYSYYSELAWDLDEYSTGKIVTLSGWYYQGFGDGGFYFQTIEYPDSYLLIDSNGSSSWMRVGIGKIYTKAQAQDLIGKLLKNNQYIFENNLLISRFANKLSYNEKVQLYNLQKRLENRDNMLRESDVFSQMQEAKIIGYSNYQNYLNDFMSSFYLSSSVGLVISTTTAIIIGVVVVASLSTAAYFAFKDAYEESVRDVKLSREMLRIFEKYNMTEEDIATIQRETQGIVTKAVLMEKINNILGNAKMLIVGGLVAYLGYQLYQKYIKK